MEAGFKFFIENAPLILVLRLRFVSRGIKAICDSVLASRWTNHTKRTFLDVIENGPSYSVGEFGDFDVAAAWMKMKRNDLHPDFGRAVGFSHNEEYIAKMLLIGIPSILEAAVSIGDSDNSRFLPRYNVIFSGRVLEVANIPTQIAMVKQNQCGIIRSWGLLLDAKTILHFIPYIIDHISEFGDHGSDLLGVFTRLAAHDETETIIELLKIVGPLAPVYCTTGNAWVPVVARTELIDVQRMFHCVLKRGLESELYILEELHSRGGSVSEFQLSSTKFRRVVEMWLEHGPNNVSTRTLGELEDWKLEMMADRRQIRMKIIQSAVHGNRLDLLKKLAVRYNIKFSRLFLDDWPTAPNPEVLKYILENTRFSLS